MGLSMIHGLEPSMATGGNIKIGGLGKEIKSARGNMFRPPRKDDHFTITQTTRTAAGDLEVDTELMNALLAADWGDDDGKLRKIPIAVHSDDPNLVMPHFYAAYAGKKLACRGDGKTATRYKFTGTDRKRLDETEEVKCTCKRLEEGQCKPHGVLHCSIMAPGCAVAGAVHRFRTTSIITLQQLLGSMLDILTTTTGILQGIPLVLRVMPINVTPKGISTTVFCCHMELRAKDQHDVIQQALQLAKLRNSLKAELAGTQQQYTRMLQPPGMESDEEAARIQAEFYNDEQPPDETAASRRTAAFRDKPASEAPPPIETTAEPVDAPPPPEPDPPQDDGSPSWYDRALAIALEIGKTEDDLRAAAHAAGIDIMPEMWGEAEMNKATLKLEE